MFSVVIKINSKIKQDGSSFAMLIVIAGFPAAFIGILFTGALLIEVIFSLDGLGLLGFEAVIDRDYPIMFASLYFFTLLGLHRLGERCFQLFS